MAGDSPSGSAEAGGGSFASVLACKGPTHKQPIFYEDCQLHNINMEGCDTYEFSFEEVQHEIEEYRFGVIGGVMGPRATLLEMKQFIDENWGDFVPKFSVNRNGVWNFNFASQEGREFVLTNGPWFFRGRFPLALSQWEIGMPAAWSSFESVPAWIQLRNLHPILNSKHMLSIIGSMIGTPIAMDEKTRVKERSDFARLLVQVAPADVLKEKVSLRDPSGKLYLQRIWYEWRPWTCEHCVKFGHATARCKRPVLAVNTQDITECNEKEQLAPPMPESGPQQDEDSAPAAASKGEKESKLAQLAAKKNTEDLTASTSGARRSLMYNRNKLLILDRLDLELNREMLTIKTQKNRIFITGSSRGLAFQMSVYYVAMAPQGGLRPMSEISLVAWNSRGCNSAPRTRQITELVRKKCISMIGILETKILKEKEIEVSKRLLPGWKYCTNSTLTDRGRIWVTWDHGKLDVDIVQVHRQFIHCSIVSKDLQVKVLATFVYASNDDRERAGLWADICNMMAGNAEPWTLLGDCNCILQLADKITFNRQPHVIDDDFCQFVANTGLSDLIYSGLHYTWNNNQEGANRIACKLDRVMVNQVWEYSFSDSQVVFADPLFSDHAPGLLRINPSMRNKQVPFKFRNFWVEEPDFSDVVSATWDMYVEGNPQYVVAMKLKRMKQVLLGWQKGRFRHLESMLEECAISLKDANSAIQADFSNIGLQRDVAVARDLYERRTRQLYSYIAQKTKMDWVKYGEESSVMFYNGLKLRGCRNPIHILKTDGGELLDSREDICREMLGFFQSLFGTCCNTRGPDFSMLEGCRIDYDHHSELCRPISDSEIYAALSGIGVKKSPGPDGFGSLFFTACWNVVKGDVCAAVRDFFRRGRLLRQTNATFVNLIPKIDNPLSVREFRPITCCNTMLKAISKILVARIGPLLDDVISLNQGAFVPGRSIVDNLAVAQDLVKGYGGKYTSPRCLIQIDLQKAYDCVSWRFLRHTLEYFEFPIRLIDWVMECVTSPSYSVIVNGEVEGFFCGARGLRQGDPMSPYLFVLIMEMLTRRMQYASQQRGFYFHPRCKQLQLTSLAFADDLLLFCKPTRSSLLIIRDVISGFSLESGLIANCNKSHIFFGGISGGRGDELAAIVGFSTGRLPVRYLGAPLHSKRLRRGDFQPLLSMIQGAMEARSARHISYAGRVQVIKTVLESIVRFWMQVIIFPKYVINGISSLCRSYLWTGEVGHGKSPIAWKRLCRDKGEGGLGFKELLAWNRTLIFKMVYDIATDRRSVWTDWARCNLVRGSVWTSRPCAGCSCIWKGVIEARDSVLTQLNSSPPNADRMTKPSGGLASSVVYKWLSPPAQKLEWCDVIWNGIQTRKWSFTCWLATQDRLPTRARLLRWGSVQDESCVMCGGPKEDAAHLWWECDVTRRVADRVLMWQGISVRFDSLMEWWNWFAAPTKRRNNVYLSKLLAIMGMVYHIWRVRNDVIFNGRTIDIDGISREIIESCKFRMMIKLRTQGRRGAALMRRLYGH